MGEQVGGHVVVVGAGEHGQHRQVPGAACFGVGRATLLIMSTAEGWDLTVPADDAELGAELRRHGVMPGQRVRLVPVGVDREQSSPAPDLKASSARFASEPQRNVPFAGLLKDAPADLASNLDAYLDGFGER